MQSRNSPLLCKTLSFLSLSSVCSSTSTVNNVDVKKNQQNKRRLESLRRILLNIFREICLQSFHTTTNHLPNFIDTLRANLFLYPLKYQILSFDQQLCLMRSKFDPFTLGFDILAYIVVDITRNLRLEYKNGN